MAIFKQLVRNKLKKVLVNSDQSALILFQKERRFFKAYHRGGIPDSTAWHRSTQLATRTVSRIVVWKTVFE